MVVVALAAAVAILAVSTKTVAMVSVTSDNVAIVWKRFFNRATVCGSSRLPK